MSEKNLISIVTPCHNAEKWIYDALESAIAQPYPPIEILVVENNSSDQTKEILKSFQSRYPHLIHYLEAALSGAPAARNEGLQHAKGEWIQFLDADDILLPEKLEHQAKLIQKAGSGFDFIASAYYYEYPSGKRKVFKPDKKNILYSCLTSTLGQTSANLFRREALMEIGGWNEVLKAAQEAELMFRLILHGGRVLVDETPLTIVRRTADSITFRDIEQTLETYLQVRLSMAQTLRAQQAGQWDIEQKELDDIIYNSIYRLAMVNPGTANEYYKQYFTHPYSPLRARSTLVPFVHALLVEVFGFEKLMRLRFWAKQWLKGLFYK